MAMPAIATTAAMALAAASQPAGSIEGHWLNPQRTVLIRMAPCGEAMCGTVTWAAEQAKEAARKGAEILVGARLLSNFRPNRNGQWKGIVFVPDLDVRVGGKIQVVDDNRLKVSGCILKGMMCRSQVWTKSGETLSARD
jgi:uncharacterized protein (DUF2147 family)